MNYKQVIEEQIKTLKSVIDKLCDAREMCKEDSEQNYFQGLIQSQVSIKNKLEDDFQKAQIFELTK